MQSLPWFPLDGERSLSLSAQKSTGSVLTRFLICSFEQRSLPILTWVRSLTSKKGPAPLTGGLGEGLPK